MTTTNHIFDDNIVSSRKACRCLKSSPVNQILRYLKVWKRYSVRNSMLV